MKQFQIGIIAIMLLSVNLISSCSDDDIDKNPSKESTSTSLSKEDLITQSLSLLNVDMNNINYDSILQETLPYSELYFYMDEYYNHFSDVAYVAIGLNENNNSMVDFYLISFKSQLAINELNPIFSTINNAKFTTYDGDPKDAAKFYAWVDGQIKNGRIVVTSYDKKTGKYTGLSYSVIEWAWLSGMGH